MTDAVRKQSDAVAKMAQDWQLIDALVGGTKAMRASGNTYLPQWPAEDTAAYKARLATATLFPAYSRTVSILTGKPFSKSLTVGEDVPARLKPWLENVDREGRNIHIFAADVANEALGYGLCGILVDYPPAGDVTTVRQEKAAGVRPYFVHVTHGALLGWRTAVVNGARVLTQLRLLEAVAVEDGPFADKVIEQVRVLEPGSWQVWRKVKNDQGESWVLHEEGTTTLKYIPFVPVYGKRVDFMAGEPPMIELAHANVEHWQSKSDQQTILHVARVPILFRKGMQPDEQFTVGSGAMITATDPAADMKYVEHSGAAIESGRLSLLDSEDRMRQIGAELLVIKPGNTTVAQTLSDDEPAKCDLQRMMEALEDGLDQALQIMADWVKEPSGGHVSLFKDFGAANLADASLDLLHKMRESGNLSQQTLLSEAKRRGTLSPDLEIDKEIQRAKADAPAEVTQVQVRD